MSYETIDEPFARPPERTDPGVAGDWSAVPVVVTDVDLGELSWQWLESAIIDLAGLSFIEIDHCCMKDVTFVNAERTRVALTASTIEESDLSQLHIDSVTESRLNGVKLVGTDFSEASTRDTEFSGCVLWLANLRMSKFERVAFESCTIDDVDAYGADFVDVGFNDSALSAFSIDRVTATRVDLRGCTSVGLTAIGRLDGFLISEHQLYALAPQLARVAGLTIQVES